MTQEIAKHTGKLVALSGTLEQVVAQCKQLHDLDKKAERTSGQLKLLGGVGLGAAVVVGLLWTWYASIAIGAVGLAVLVLGFRASRQDIEDRKLAVGEQILHTLGGELAPGKPVSIDFDFRSYDDATAEDSWLVMRMTLQNGVRVAVQAGQRWRRKTKNKRKYTKITDKLQDRLLVQYTPPKGKAFNPAATPRSGTRIPGAHLDLVRCKVAPRGATFQFMAPEVVRVKGRYGWVARGEEGQLGGKGILAAIITSYQLLSQAQQTA